MCEKTRYTEEELKEFKALIEEKMAIAQQDYDHYMDVLSGKDSNDVMDTSPTFHALEECSNTLNKEEVMTLMARQEKFICGLKAALVRVANGTYGICRETGKLIPKERLRAVPHATLCIEAKMNKRK
jgi:RNA polymerase-binding transcription factor DksA